MVSGAVQTDPISITNNSSSDSIPSSSHASSSSILLRSSLLDSLSRPSVSWVADTVAGLSSSVVLVVNDSLGSLGGGQSVLVVDAVLGGQILGAAVGGVLGNVGVPYAVVTLVGVGLEVLGLLACSVELPVGGAVLVLEALPLAGVLREKISILLFEALL